MKQAKPFAAARAARTVIGLLVAVAGLWIAFRGVDLAELRAALGAARWSWLAAAAAVAVLAVIVRAWRWQLLLAPIERVSMAPLVSATMIGYFGNGVLPLRMGELMRAVAIGRRARGLDTSTALGSIAVERILDVLSALAVAAVVVPLAGEHRLGGVAWAVPTAITVGAVALLWWVSRWSWARAFATADGDRGGRLGALAGSFLRGLLVLGSRAEGRRAEFALIAGQSLVIWACYGLYTWLAARASGVPLDAVQTGLVMVVTTVAVSVPAAPGYVGTFHAAAVLVVGDWLGHPPARAQAFAILGHAASWLPTVVIGAWCFVNSAVRMRDVGAADAGGIRATAPVHGSNRPVAPRSKK